MLPLVNTTVIPTIYPNTPNTVKTIAINAKNKQVDKTSSKLHHKCRILIFSATEYKFKCPYYTIHKPICDINTGQMAMTFPSSLAHTAFLALTQYEITA